MKTFAQLYAGRTDCYGSGPLAEKREDGKRKAEGRTHRGDLTDDLWLDHLEGRRMLGIVPIMPDGTCSWFAIDIDDYKLDHASLVKEIERRELPLIATHTKSGGSHLYCFTTGGIPGSLAMKLAKKWAEDLRIQKYEIFPKQSANPEDAYGNWIYIPYFGTITYALGMNAERLSLQEFEQYANAKMITPKEAKELLSKVTTSNADDVWGDAPPCIQCFQMEGIGEGGRNTVLSHMCVFYQKVAPEDWEELVNKFNYDYIDPPLKRNEVDHIISSFKRKRYAYLCHQEPMASKCDKETCLKRKYGVGQDAGFYGDLQIDGIVKIDSRPPTWILDIRGQKIKVDSDTLITPRKFKLMMLEELNEVIPLMKQSAHDAIIAPLMQSSLVIEAAPDEVSTPGMLLFAFREWTKNMLHRSRSREDLLRGLPYYDKANRRIIFRGDDFTKMFSQNMKFNIPPHKLWAQLRDMGCTPDQDRIRRDVVRFWVYTLGDNEELWFQENQDDKF